MASAAYPAGLLKNQGNINDSAVTVVGPGGKAGLVHIIDWGVGVAQGEVTIEASNSPTYTGTWAVIQVVNFQTTSAGVMAPKQDVVQAPGKYKAYRHRVTFPVAGGTVSTRVSG